MALLGKLHEILLYVWILDTNSNIHTYRFVLYKCTLKFKISKHVSDIVVYFSMP